MIVLGLMSGTQRPLRHRRPPPGRHGETRPRPKLQQENRLPSVGQGLSRGRYGYRWGSKPGCTVVSTDDLREELFGSAEVRHGQGVVFETAHRRVAEALKAGRDVVFDATNTRPAYRRSLLNGFGRRGSSSTP